MKLYVGLIGAVVLALAGMGALGAWSADQTVSASKVAVSSAPPAPTHAPAIPDQCGAGDLADLVGKPRTDIPVPVDPSHRRVYCTTCMVTQDYDPTRLNIVFDAQTGIVKTVKCG